MSNSKRADSGAAEGARRATGEAPESSGRRGKGRWSSKRKAAVVGDADEQVELWTSTQSVTVTELDASGVERPVTESQLVAITLAEPRERRMLEA